MTIVLYDLVGRDDRRFSPHCWRTRMALAHKGLAHEARPTRFGDIRTIGGGEVKTIPAIEDGDRRVVDSGEIARYLEATYPDRPSLFGGPGGMAVTRLVENWSAAVVHAVELFNQLSCGPKGLFTGWNDDKLDFCLLGLDVFKPLDIREARVDGHRFGHIARLGHRRGQEWVEFLGDLDPGAAALREPFD